MKIMNTIWKRISLTGLAVFWGRCPCCPLSLSFFFKSFLRVLFFFFSFFLAMAIPVAFKPKCNIILVKADMHAIKTGVKQISTTQARNYDAGSAVQEKANTHMLSHASSSASCFLSTSLLSSASSSAAFFASFF